MILPVKQDSLVWIRTALSQLTPLPKCPIVTLSKGVKTSALMDLIDLGVSEYIFEQDDLSHVRIRLLTLMERQKNHQALLYQASQKSAEQAQMGRTDQVLSTLEQVAQTVKKTRSPRKRSMPNVPKMIGNEVVDYSAPFQDAKSKMIREFERNYIVQALIESKGNICMAAQKSNKHRRAFWELMRKHEIDADDYREVPPSDD